MQQPSAPNSTPAHKLHSPIPQPAAHQVPITNLAPWLRPDNETNDSTNAGADGSTDGSSSEAQKEKK